MNNKETLAFDIDERLNPYFWSDNTLNNNSKNRELYKLVTKRLGELIIETGPFNDTYSLIREYLMRK